METIKNYIMNMFMNLPDTPEVEKAKKELLQMMEDKYTELKAEGKTENEAIGIAISEFGNLEELAESLGISGIMQKEGPEGEDAVFSMEQAESFLKAKGKSACLIAIGVMLCIFSVTAPICLDAIGSIYSLRGSFCSAIGVTLMFIIIAAAVVMFVYAGMLMKDWENMEKKGYVLGADVRRYVRECNTEYKSRHILRMTTGICLCVLSVIPTIILSEIDVIHDNFSAAALFIMVGIGVYLIVRTSVKQSGFDDILKLEEKGKAGSISKKEEGAMALYWPTISCIYLCWSFLTFDWHLTWIIWPVAAVVRNLLDVILKEEN